MRASHPGMRRSDVLDPTLTSFGRRASNSPAPTFPLTYDWTPTALTGFVLSTSVLSRQVLGDHVSQFKEDLARTVQPWASDGRLRQPTRFAYELAYRPELGYGTSKDRDTLRSP